MHEVDMTKCLLISLNEWRDRQAQPTAMVETVHLDVGRFTCVEPNQLVTTYNAAVQGSWLDGSELTITEIPFVGRCVACNASYNPVPESAYRSPCCDHPLKEIVSGRELRIRSIDYRTDARAALESGQIQRTR
ncbi:MAG: hydrogenase maturation nickel metallochaperone HypA [Aphanocapsa feldmannii 277cV]|uniref:Hydrogenase maturation nickel metallochaperone HypA n=2 Tax=Aphanocapsa feldmannii TaxID=192050 RepID=A0A524RML4_9CHRO|nr:MAG: hydrogenase maturation nickel metallochaperone HypA [Aphanocapsa feldmannii 288cV]TGG91885.1 MAG: hydrogenase maturation nickel metallochaperone HypA [Aphanocapsa feldmannii 277cV]TGH20528.1 MAG: hydrogenase maturation nickel metallochaperone HypA [Aphanocapsa feldmannii 277cI]